MRGVEAENGIEKFIFKSGRVDAWNAHLKTESRVIRLGASPIKSILLERQIGVHEAASAVSQILEE